jgi:hypothetical protein
VPALHRSSLVGWNDPREALTQPLGDQ